MAEFRIEKSDETDYARFLSDNPPANPFSLPAFLEVYRDVFSTDLIYLIIFRNSQAVAATALYVARRLSLPIITTLPVRVYDGVHFRKLGDSTSQKQEYEKLHVLEALEQYLARNFAFYHMFFPPGFTDIRPFQWAGARVVPRFTYVVDLPTLSESNYTLSLKQALRSAQSSGLRVGQCHVEEFAALHGLSYERHRRHAPVSSETVTALLNKLKSKGLLEITAVRNPEGKVLAALAGIPFGTTSYVLMSGMLQPGEDTKRGASHLAHHEYMLAEKKSGKLHIDFCGANTPSINMFKSSFGPRLETYFEVSRPTRFAAVLASYFKKS